jgi:hypothetical protein
MLLAETKKTPSGITTLDYISKRKKIEEFEGFGLPVSTEKLSTHSVTLLVSFPARKQ